MWALDTGIGLMLHDMCDTMKVTMGSTIVGLAHPISQGEKAKAFPWLSSIFYPREVGSHPHQSRPSVAFHRWTRALCCASLVSLDKLQPLSSVPSHPSIREPWLASPSVHRLIPGVSVDCLVLPGYLSELLNHFIHIYRMPHGMVGVEPMTFWSYWATLPIELHPSMHYCIV